MIAILALASLLAAGPASAAGGALPDQWKNWRYFAPVETGAGSQPEMVRVTLPLTAIAHAQSADVPDLRVIDDTGGEAPFVIDIQRGSRAGVWRFLTTSESGFVPGSYSQIVAENTALELTDTLLIVSTETDYFVYVEISASDDHKTWRVIRERAPIFKFERDKLGGTQSVTFPATRAQWLRVRVLDPAKSFNIDSIEVNYTQVKPAELEPWPLTFAATPAGEAQQTWLQADAGGAVPGSVVEIDAPGEYHRAVRVSVSDDGSTYTEVGEGAITRGPGETSDRVAFDEASGRYWRITIFDRNDPPIVGLSARLLASPRHVAFRQLPGRTYQLLYGNSRATAPRYDVSDLTTPSQRAAAPTVTLGPEQTNTAYVSPEPWTETHPTILWIALAIAVVVMGGLAIRTLRR